MNSTYKKIVRGVAIYDMISTVGMAVPGVSVLTLQFYAFIHKSLELGGDFPHFSPAHQLFVNVVGILAFVWALGRIHLLDRFLVACDAGARLAVAMVILYSVFVLETSQVFLVFAVTEFLGAGLEFWALKRF